MQVPIVFCADENFGQYLPVVVQSIIENASFEHEYHIIVFDCGIKPEDLVVLERQLAKYDHFILQVNNISTWLDQHNAFLVARGAWSSATYGRLLIPELCSHYEKVIYADVDMIFNRDLAELMQIDLENFYIAGVVDSVLAQERNERSSIKNYMETKLHLSPSHLYINAGLLVMNIAAWQQNTLAHKMMAFLSEQDLDFLDQDAINSVCRGKISYLPSDWNDLGWGGDYYTENGAFAKKVIHYVRSIKPWHNLAVREASIWWHYAAKTENHDRLLWEASIQKLSINLEEGNSFCYCLFGVPVLRGKIYQTKIKYYLFGMRRGHIATWQNGTKQVTQAFYLFGLKLFSKKTSS